DGKQRRYYTMRLHPKMDPPAIEGAETKAAKASYYGSYRLRGGELTMIIVQGGTFAGRPQDFDGKAQHPPRLPRAKRGTSGGHRNGGRRGGRPAPPRTPGRDGRPSRRRRRR